MEELELTFLAKELPLKLKVAKSKQLLDVYLPSTAKHPTLRIRKSSDRHEITKKEPIKEMELIMRWMFLPVTWLV